MTKTFIARNITAGDTFETNYPGTEGGTFISGFPRELTEANASEVETNLVFPNLTTRKIAFHVEIGKVDWADDRIGAADWSTIFKVGAVGDTEVQLDTVEIQRVSADGNTIRASIVVVSGATDTMGADATITNNESANTSLDNPGGAAIDDHLVLLFIMDNTGPHGGDETTSVEQNLTGSTRIVAPIDDALPDFNANRGQIIG